MKKYYYLLLIPIILISCSKNDEINSLPKYQAGVVLTLDDDYVYEWEMAQDILKNYSWKATFCVSKVNQFSPEKIVILKALENYGHEIAGHSLNHINAVEYSNSYGVEAYFNNEISPMMSIMNANSFAIKSFAYPYGARNNSIDTKLFSTFNILRGTTYGALNPNIQNCYYNNSNLVYGLGIDSSYSHFSISYFIKLLEYAKLNHKILILYAHKPVLTANASYQTDMNTLIQICNYVNQNNMKFYKLSELYNLWKNFES